MELRHLRYFVAVAEELHFTRAAERLGIAQPPLSLQIQLFEKEIGVPLFNRDRRRITLTEAGKVVLAEAKDILSSADQISIKAGQTARGVRGWLGIGFVASAMYGLLPKILRDYRLGYPDVRLELFDLEPEAQMQALAEDKIHIAFTRSVELTSENCQSLVTETILREPLVVAVPELHPLAQQDQIPLRELAHEPFILFSRSFRSTENPFVRQIIEFCRRAGFSPRAVQHARETHTALGLVAAGLGVSLVPASMANLKRAGVVLRPLAEDSPMIDLLMIYKPEKSPSTLHTFLEAVHRIIIK